MNLKEFLADSYTKYKSKIGPEADGDYLSKSKDVVLVWPYKDCLLEGGQTKAERENRSEIFWNETLAPEHYDRILCEFAKQCIITANQIRNTLRN